MIRESARIIITCDYCGSTEVFDGTTQNKCYLDITDSPTWWRGTGRLDRTGTLEFCRECVELFLASREKIDNER